MTEQQPKEADSTPAPVLTTAAPAASSVEAQPSAEQDLQALLASRITQLENDASRREQEERQASTLTKQQKLKDEREADRIKARFETYQHESESRLTKLMATKSKLETLCRELQKQNKLVMEDSKRMAEEEQTKRSELSKKFHETIREITQRLEEQGEERARQLHENETLREKLRNFAEQYDIREQHYATQMRAKELERQLLEARLKQQSEIAIQEAMKAQAYLEQANAMAKTEADLRGQISLYADKFEQFQETLSKSNDVFATFKQEMERMSKSISKLEKEKAALKKKVDSSDAALVELATERNSLRQLVEHGRAGRKKLEDLCRALQTERQLLRQEVDTLRAGNAPCSPEAEPATAAADNIAEQQQPSTEDAAPAAKEASVSPSQPSPADPVASSVEQTSTPAVK